MLLPKLTSRLLGAVIAFCIACTVPAMSLAMPAQSEREAAFAQWSIVDTGGCHMILNHGSMGLDANGREMMGGGIPLVRIVWTGACDGDGLISGPGSLVVEWDAKPLTNFSGVVQNLYNGRAQQGRLEGRVRRSFREPETDGGPPVMVDEDRQWEELFEHSCGKLEDDPPECDSGSSNPLLAQYLAPQTGSEPGLSQGSVVANGGRVTAVATPAAAAGRNPFLNSCLSLKAPEGDREPGSWGANVWTIQNSCPARLYVTWCADEDSRSSLRNVCVNKTAVTNELPANGSIIFDSAAAQLSIQAFACRATDFPKDVVFTEDRRLTSSGC